MERAFKPVNLGFAQIEHLCRKYFQEGNLQVCQLLSGGAINTTYKIAWQHSFYVLRIYVRDPELAQIEESIYHLIRHKVPLPKLFYVGLIENSYPFAIFEFINKKHLFEITNSRVGPALSYDLGRALANIHSFHFSQAGLFGKGLTMHTSFEEGSTPYFVYTMEHLSESSLAWQRLGEARARKLKDFLQKHQDFFPTIGQGGVLVHSDFKPVNLLWDEQGGLTILDWEFAHSGHPLLDFALLLRHFQDFPLNIESLEKGYAEQGGVLPDNWIQKARITDSINLIQLLNTPAQRPQLFTSLIQSVDFTLEGWAGLDNVIRKSHNF